MGKTQHGSTHAVGRHTFMQNEKFGTVADIINIERVSQRPLENMPETQYGI